MSSVNAGKRAGASRFRPRALAGRALPVGALLALLLVLVPAWALAHSMYVFAYIDGGLIKGEGAYGDGSPAAGAVVEVHDSKGKLIGRSKTSAEGRFSLPLQAGSPPFEVEIKDGGGHASSSTFGPEQAAQAGAPAVQPVQPPAPGPGPQAGPAIPAGREDLARLLRRELEPVKAQLARLAAQKAIGPSEVVGGLGWIVGLVGLALWFKSRKP